LIKYLISISWFIPLVFLSGCTLFEKSAEYTREPPEVTGLENIFNPPNQLFLSEYVFSPQLFIKENVNTAPIIRLNSDQQLQLRFETLGLDSRQFRISFSHHNPDWSRSPLPPERFIDGFYMLTLSGGQLSRDRQPGYRQFIYNFPNRDFSFRHSGNYMIRIEDTDTGNLLFTMPFYVYENEGVIRSSVDRQLTPRQDLRTRHYPISRFEPPYFLDQPQFDLQFYYVQNRFWGRAERSNELDFSALDHVQFEMRRESSFVGDYEFRWLSLDRISQQVEQVAEVDLTTDIPVVILNDDSEGFSNQPPRNINARTGFPDPGLDARYANVFFRLDHEQEIPPGAEIHVVGDFNNWTIHSGSKMNYLSDIDRWQGSAVIKTGSYHYKYVLIDNNRIDDLAFDSRFTFTPQEYHAFVYMRDQTRQSYRLLQVNHFFSN